MLSFRTPKKEESPLQRLSKENNQLKKKVWIYEPPDLETDVQILLRWACWREASPEGTLENATERTIEQRKLQCLSELTSPVRLDTNQEDSWAQRVRWVHPRRRGCPRTDIDLHIQTPLQCSRVGRNVHVSKNRDQLQLSKNRQDIQISLAFVPVSGWCCEQWVRQSIERQEARKQRETADRSRCQVTGLR